MSEYESPRPMLEFLGRPGIVEILLTLHAHEGRATLDQIRAAGVSRPTRALRSLTAAGYLRTGDTLDHEPDAGTVFTFTDFGEGLAATLVETAEWGRRYAARHPKGWTSWLTHIRRAARLRPLRARRP